MHECVQNFHFAAKEEEGMLYVIGNWNSLPRIQEKPSLLAHERLRGRQPSAVFVRRLRSIVTVTFSDLFLQKC